MKNRTLKEMFYVWSAILTMLLLTLVCGPLLRALKINDRDFRPKESKSEFDRYS